MRCQPLHTQLLIASGTLSVSEDAIVACTCHKHPCQPDCGRACLAFVQVCAASRLCLALVLLPSLLTGHVSTSAGFINRSSKGSIQELRCCTVAHWLRGGLIRGHNHMSSCRLCRCAHVDCTWQVHRATLHTGEDVVVKVQRPGLRALFDIDLANLRQLATIIDKGDEARDVLGIYEECATILYREIDYIFEGRSADRCCWACFPLHATCTSSV